MKVSAKPIQLNESDEHRLATVLAEDVSRDEGQLATHVDQVKKDREYLKLNKTVKTKFTGASKYQSSFVKETIQAQVSQTLPQLLNTVPILRAQGNDKRSEAMTTALENFYESLYRRYMNYPAVIRRAGYAAYRDGTVAVIPYWRKEWDYVEQHEETDNIDVNMQTGEVSITTEQLPPKRVAEVVYNYPELDVVFLENLVILPFTAADVDRAVMTGWKTTKTGHELLQYVKAGVLDKKRVDELLAVGASDTDSQATPDDQAKGIKDEQPTHDGTPLAPNENSIFVIGQYYRKFKATGEEFASDWYCVMEESTQKILAARPRIFYCPIRPIAIFAPYQSEQLISDNVVQLGAGHIQDNKDISVRTMMNSLLKRVEPKQWIANSMYEALKKLHDEDRFNELGALVPLADENFNAGNFPKSDIVGVSPNEMMQFLEYNDVNGSRSTMVQDAQRNVPTGSTATEVALANENATKTNGILIERLAESIVRLGTIIHWMCRHYQKEESLINLWNEVNGDTGIEFEDAMAGSYTFEANGLSATTSKVVRSQRAMQKFQLLSALPEVMNNPELKYKLFADTMREATDDRQPEDNMGTVEEWKQNAQQPTPDPAQLQAQQSQQQQEMQQAGMQDKLMTELLNRQDARKQHEDKMNLSGLQLLAQHNQALAQAEQRNKVPQGGQKK